MADNEKVETETSEVIEKLKVVVAAETEEIKNSHKRKFDEISEKLQQIEESVSKMAKLEKSTVSNNQNKKELNSEKKFLLKNVFENVKNLKEGDTISKTEDHFNLKWCTGIQRSKTHTGLYINCKPIEPVEKKYAIETKLELRMMGADDNKVTKTKRRCFENGMGIVYNSFMRWKEMEKDYLIDDKLTVEVEVEILKMDGFEREREIENLTNLKKRSPMWF